MTVTVEGITEQLRIIAPRTAETWARLVDYPPARKAFKTWLEIGTDGAMRDARYSLATLDVNLAFTFPANTLFEMLDKLPLAWKREAMGHREPPQMVTAVGGFLEHVCHKVAGLLIGERMNFSLWRLADQIPSYEHNGATFTAPDRVLGNIVGSAWTHSYEISPGLKPGEEVVIFTRHPNTGRVWFADPDRRGA